MNEATPKVHDVLADVRGRVANVKDGRLLDRLLDDLAEGRLTCQRWTEEQIEAEREWQRHAAMRPGD